MKTSFLTTLLVFILLGSRSLQAQLYSPYYDPYWEVQYQQYLQYQHYLQWQQYLAYLQQYDPYYELHVMHYQLYLPPGPSYQLYPTCCFGGDVVIVQQPPVGSRPRPVMDPKLRAFVGARSQTAVSTPSRATGQLPGAVGSLPRATGPLPPAAAPLPPAIGRR